MSGLVKIDIAESPETLKTLLLQQKTAQDRERVQALYLLKTKQVETVQHLALRFGESPDYSTTLVTSRPRLRDSKDC